MEQFLLKNAKLYQNLVSNLTPSTATPNVSSLTGGRREQARTSGTHHVADPNMVVSARIRPFLDEDVAAGFPNAMFPRTAEGEGEGQQKQGVVDIHDLYNHPRGRPLLRSYNYQVDRLFDGDTTTQTIYDELVANLIPFARAGGTATLFAYGQTGSGKTYTISQLEQLAIEALMTSDTTSDSATKEGQYRHEISVMIIELAGNSVFNLLSSSDGEGGEQERKPVAVRDDASGTTQLVGASEHVVTSKDQVLRLVEQAASFRRSAPTFKNAASSRSHAVCRIRIKRRRVIEGEDNSADKQTDSNNKDGFLYLIDLAGSEAARDVTVHGNERMREAREINISLSVLKDCIRGKADADAAAAAAAASNKPAPAPPRIPYRQAALTRILRHIFDPAAASATASQACRTVVIACVNPSLADVGASKNTLRYAELLRVSVPAKGVQVPAEGQTRAQVANGNTEGRQGAMPPQTRPQVSKKTAKSTTSAKGTVTKVPAHNKVAAYTNTRDPSTWDNAKLKDWLGRKLESSMAASSLAANSGGAAFLQLSPDELDRRRLTLGPDTLSTQELQGLVDQMRALQPR